MVLNVKNILFFKFLYLFFYKINILSFNYNNELLLLKFCDKYF